MIQTCPSETLLRQFNEGRIDDLVEIDRISEHLGLCEECLNKLEAMAPGPIVEGLRQSVSQQLIASDTDMSEQDFDLESVRGSLDDMISQVESMYPDLGMDTAEFGENRYQVIGLIGEGDFSSVYGALPEDITRTDTTVAASDLLATQSSVQLIGIKIPHATKLTSYRHSQQFFADCEKAKLLQNPGIQPVLEFGHWDENRLFLAKPLLQHPTLTKFAKCNPSLSQDLILLIFRQIVDAIDYAHQQNVIHRHLSPDNIHVIIAKKSEFNAATGAPPIQIVMSDFGFVLDSRYHFDLIEAPSSRTPFVSPESATLNAEFIDVRSDIYSMGKILKLLIRLGSDLPDADRLKKIIEKSTCLRRRDRYQTVSELQAALDLI